MTLQFDDLEQDRSVSSALAIEIPQSCTKSLIHFKFASAGDMSNQYA